MSDDLEIIIEPDVVPRGTVDLRALDAPPGARPPAVRIDASGRVLPLGLSSRIDLRTSGERARQPAEEPPPTTVTTPSFDPVLAATPDAEPDPDAAAAVPLPSDAELAELDAAANRPIPPRPAAALAGGERELVTAGAPADELEFDTLGGTRLGTAWEVSRLLLWLLFCTASVVLLALWLGHRPLWRDGEVASSDEVEIGPGQPKPSQQPPPEPDTAALLPTDAAVVPDAPEQPAATPEEPVPEELTPEAVPEEIPAEPPALPEPEEVSPELAPQGEPAPTAEEALASLRAIAEQVETGAEVELAEDAQLAARIAALRAQAAEALAAGESERATAALEELLGLLPDDPDGLFQMGVVLETAERYEDAEGYYARTTEVAPADPRGWNNLALMQLRRGATAEGKASLERGLAAAPGDPNVLTNLANLMVDATPSQAHPLYDKALAGDPNHVPARLGRARARERLGDGLGAHEDYTLLTSVKSALVRADAHGGLGRLARSEGRLDAAVAEFEASIASADRPEVRVNLGSVLLALGRTTEAVPHLEQAVRAMPDRAVAWRTLAVAYARLSKERPRYQEPAKKAYQHAIKLEPDSWIGYYNYALFAEQTGNFPVAIQLYERAIERDPRAWRASANLARLYHEGSDSTRALEILDRAVQHADDAAELHLQRAYLLAQQSRAIEARAALRRFIALAPPGDPRLVEIERRLNEHGGS